MDDNLIKEANRWMVGRYTLNELSQGAVNKVIKKFVNLGNDDDIVSDTVNKFNELQKKNQVKGVDIFSISFGDLKKLVDDKYGTPTKTQDRRDKDKVVRDVETDFVYDNENVMVISPKSHKSSCKYGANTKWCTASKEPEAFKGYIELGDKLYYIIPKDGSDKYAVKMSLDGSREVYNAKDEEIDGTNEYYDMVKKFDIPEEIFKSNNIDDFGPDDIAEFTNKDIQIIIDNIESVMNNKIPYDTEELSKIIKHVSNLAIGYGKQRTPEHKDLTLPEYKKLIRGGVSKVVQESIQVLKKMIADNNLDISSDSIDNLTSLMMIMRDEIDVFKYHNLLDEMLAGEFEYKFAVEDILKNFDGYNWQDKNYEFI